MPLVLGAYRDVLALPGALAFSAAGVLARLEIAMASLGAVLLVEHGTGSYGLGGAVAGTLGVTAAVASPQLARLVDRFGQARVLRPAVCAHAAAVLALVLLVTAGAPIWTLVIAALASGATTVSVGALVRARWGQLLRGRAGLHTAFSLESVLDELVFIVGPLVVIVLATTIHPAAGLLVAATATLAGSFLLTAQRTTEPRPTGARAAGSSALLRFPGLVVLAVVFFAAGGIFGSAELAVVAFADAAGRPAAAGPVLALYALGSLLAGLVYGVLQWRAPADRRFVLVVGFLAAGTVPMALAPTLPVLAAAMFLAGLAISPVIVTGYGLVEALVPADRLTEGLTWATTGLSLSYAGSAAVTGLAIDAYGARRAFLLPLCCGLVAAVVALAGRRWLRSPSPAPVRR